MMMSLRRGVGGWMRKGMRMGARAGGNNTVGINVANILPMNMRHGHGVLIREL